MKPSTWRVQHRRRPRFERDDIAFVQLEPGDVVLVHEKNHPGALDAAETIAVANRSSC